MGFGYLPDRTLKENPRLWPTPFDYLKTHRWDGRRRLLCIGDSLTTDTTGYYPVEIQDILRNRFGWTNYAVNRAAYAGYRWGDIPFDSIMDAYPDAQVITIMLGTNDTKVTPPYSSVWMYKYYAFKAFRDVILKKRPDAAVRLMQIPWIRPDTTDGTFLPWTDWAVKKDRMNRFIRSLARHWGLPEALDMYAITEGQDNYYSADGLHFNQTGGRHIAPHLVDLLRTVSHYTANPDFLTGKPYTLTGGVISAEYPETDRKLTKGIWSYELADQVGFRMADNAATITVTIEFWFGRGVVLNDVIMVFGRNGSAYSPDQVVIKKHDGTNWVQEASLDYTTEESADWPLAGCTQLPYFVVYDAPVPFTTKGLQIQVTKTFSASLGRDWLFIGDISATALSHYS